MATTSRGMPMNIHRVGAKMPMATAGREEPDRKGAPEEKNPKHAEPKRKK